MPKDESEAFYQMLEALMSARRYILAQQYYAPELLAEIDAAIRRAEAEQRGHLTPEDWLAARHRHCRDHRQAGRSEQDWPCACHRSPFLPGRPTHAAKPDQ